MKTQVELNADASEKIRYNDPAYPIYHCPGRLSDYPNYTALNHWHEDLEFIVVHSGSMSYNVSGEILTLNSGEGLIVNARQMHYGFSPDRTECTFLCLLLHPQLLFPLPSFKRNLIDPLIENTAAPFVFLRPEIPWQKEIRDHILAIEAGADTHSAPLQALSRMAAIGALLVENLPPAVVTDVENPDLRCLKVMVGTIHLRFAQKLTLAQIAASGAVGQSKCCKLFMRFLNQTPMAYVNQYRLYQSLELLRNTAMSVTEIALAVGFGSASYYAEAFRKGFDQSPTQYRKEHNRLQVA